MNLKDVLLCGGFSLALPIGQTLFKFAAVNNERLSGPLVMRLVTNVPLLGALFGTQNNARTRKELLVLITPHVIRTTTDATNLTADLEQALPNAATVPAELATMPQNTAADPNQALRSKIQQ